MEGINITMPNGGMDPWHALSVVLPTDKFYEAGGGADPAAVQAVIVIVVVIVTLIVMVIVIVTRTRL